MAPFSVTMRDHSTAEARNKGTVKVVLEVKKRVIRSEIRNVLHVPNLNYSLLSVSELDRGDMSVLFKNSKYSVLKNDITIAEGTLDDGLYLLKTTDDNPDSIAKRNFSAGDLSYGTLD